MVVMSFGRRGDQVTLTSALHEFPEAVCVEFEYLLQESKPGTSGALSVYLLTTKHVPIRLRFKEIRFPGAWKKGRVHIPSGAYHVMFLATLGLPYHSDIYLDNIADNVRSYFCDDHSVKPTGNINFLTNGTVRASNFVTETR